MPQPYLDLPQPEDDFDERLVADVRNHGWHCVLVADEDHRELVLVGRWERAHAILAEAVDLIAGSRRLAPGEVSDQMLQGYEVRFGPVSDEQRVELLTYADWANRRWPEDPDYNAYAQPLLG